MTVSSDLDTLEGLAQSGAFEEAMAGLELVVTHLEDGRLSLSEAVRWYEIGLALSQRCARLLKQTEMQIQVLESTYDVDQFGDADLLESVD